MHAPCFAPPVRLLGLAALLASALAGPAVEPKDIDVEKELIIRDVKVVEWKEAMNAPDGGRFTIEHLLQGISRDGTARTALLDWLGVWKTEAGIEVGQQILNAWKASDGAQNTPTEDWQPNFTNAPFRLLAITNRLDLQRRDADGLPLHAGEGRFVFGITQGPGNSGNELQATVIFEYELPAATKDQVMQWAAEWHELGQFPDFNDDYLNALAALTERFTKAGAASHKPNGSALNQLRTNEISFSNTWNLREFRVDPATGKFFPATTKQTPADAFAKRDNPLRDPLTASYINDHETEILAQRHHVPPKYFEAAFLGREATVPNPSTVIWNPIGVRDLRARYLFSFNTCNGCHGAETQTFFTHIKPRAKGQPADLSAFLSDIAPRDTLTGSVHGELAEITARQSIMALVLNGTLPGAFAALSADQKARAAAQEAALLELLAARVNREH